MDNDITMSGLHAVQDDCIKAVKREMLEQKARKDVYIFHFLFPFPSSFFFLLYFYNLKYNMKIFALSAIVATALATVSEAAVSR